MQRADRNFAELLQELRILSTAVQILLGFMLTLAFSAGFTSLTPIQHGAYAVALLAAALSSVLLIAPVAGHRVLFQCGPKRALVRWAHVTTLAALTGIAITLCSGLFVVLYSTIGQRAAVVSIAVFFALLVGLWLILPLAIHRITAGTGHARTPR
jgi:hypothetical protein